MRTPKFSIIIPTYNRGYILWKTIQSIQQQTFEDFELLIIDDGSTDDTKKVVLQFQSDKRISYFFQKNKGVSSARNFGLKKAKGEIISYVDSDDTIYPKCLERALNSFLKNTSISYMLVKAKRVLELYDEHGFLLDSKPEIFEIKKPTLQDFYDWSVKASIGTGFFHKNTLSVTWNESLQLLEGLDFIMQCALSDPSGFMFLDEELAFYKQKYGTDGLCSKASYEDCAKAFQLVYDHHKNDPLMKNPSVYLNRVSKYQAMQKSYEKGEILDPVYKFFPEYSPASP